MPSKNTGRGRPVVESEGLTVRLPSVVIEAIDAARREAGTFPSRQDIIRMAVEDWTKRKGFLK